MKFPPPITSLITSAKVICDRISPSRFSSASVLLASVLVSGSLLGIRHLGGLQALELAAYDWMVRLKSEKSVDPRLLIVEITEADIQNQQRWPLSDRVVAQLLKQLQQYQPKVIGLDLHRDIPHLPGNKELLQQLQADNVIAIYELGIGAERGISVPPPPGLPEDRLGFNDFVVDPDDVLRRNLMYGQSPSGDQKAYSFSLQVSRHYLGEEYPLQITPNSLEIGTQTELSRLKANTGGYQLEPLEAEGWQTLLKYRSRQVARQVTLTEALNGKIDPDWVRDKVVLIGTTAPSEKDIFLTPLDRISGVEAHARQVNQILSTVLNNEPQVWFWSEWQEWLWIWGWSLVGGVLVWQGRRPIVIGGALVTALGTLGGITYGLFIASGWVPVAAPALGLIVTGGCILANKFFYGTYHDALTGLPNRSLFIKTLKQIGYAKRQSAIAVVDLDFDRFRMINDSLGYQVGDRLLTAAAKRLEAVLPRNGQVARVGGNEFAFCLIAPGNIGEAIEAADKLHKELTLPYKIDGQEIYTTVSVGISYSNPVRQAPVGQGRRELVGDQFVALSNSFCSEGRNWDSNRSGKKEPRRQSDRNKSEEATENLLRNARIAMYRAKALRKTRPEVFRTQMHTQTVKRWYLEADLRQAIEREEFELYYQPLICLKTGRIVGFEALVRWQSSRRGLVLPDEFIPVAEETGIIIPLGQKILHKACYQTKLWQMQFPDTPLTISVNLSRRQFSQPELLSQIKQILENVGLDSQSLKLEITESAIADNLEEAIALLHRLKALNLRLSIDDFGTGYSSFSALHHFPIDTLKVDKSFVRRLENSGKYAEIASTIVILGHNLGMDVVAEGIETESQLQRLQALGCEYGQGYFFAKPLSAEAATALLEKSPKWSLLPWYSS